MTSSRQGSSLSGLTVNCLMSRRKSSSSSRKNVLIILPAEWVEEEDAQFFLHCRVSEMNTFTNNLVSGFHSSLGWSLLLTLSLLLLLALSLSLLLVTITVTINCCSSLTAGLQAGPLLASVCPELQCWAVLPVALAAVNSDLAI